MRTKIKKNNMGVIILSTISIAMLSACGGSSNSQTPTPTPAPIPTPAPAPTPEPTPEPASFPIQVAVPGATVVNDNGSLILAESGLSLYIFDNDALGTSSCDGVAEDTDTCAGKWPPLLAADEATATAKMTIITRSDDSKQWAYNGQALYHWHQDAAQGDIGGDGIGNVWHLARPVPLKMAAINGINSYVGNQTISSVTDSNDVLTAIRAGKDGFTLYTFDNDPIDDSACAGNCINAWPPLLADAGAMATAPLSVITASNGNSQWAQKGKPLYFFASDTAAGDANGDDVGNVWHLIKPSVNTSFIHESNGFGSVLSIEGDVHVMLRGTGTNDFVDTQVGDTSGSYPTWTIARP
jgi:predicted lipoprotein with Yx(FWY)xxD motif